MSTDRWVDKKDMVHIYNKILLIHIKEQSNIICSNMDAIRDYYTKGSQKDKYEKLGYKWTSLRNRNRFTDIENSLEGRNEWEFGVSRYKLLYIEWINNKILLYSTENCIQYNMINHNGKEHFWKEWIHTHTHMYV